MNEPTSQHVQVMAPALTPQMILVTGVAVEVRFYRPQCGGYHTAVAVSCHCPTEAESLARRCREYVDALYVEQSVADVHLMIDAVTGARTYRQDITHLVIPRPGVPCCHAVREDLENGQ